MHTFRFFFNTLPFQMLSAIKVASMVDGNRMQVLILTLVLVDILCVMMELLIMVSCPSCGTGCVVVYLCGHVT